MTGKQKALRVLREVVAWLFTALLIFAFFSAGAAKLSSSGGWVTAFRIWGYPVWFRILIGVLEILAALLLVLPRFAPYGCMLIAVIMFGGIGTHIAVHDFKHITSELGPLLFSTIVFLLRRGRMWRPQAPLVHAATAR